MVCLRAPQLRRLKEDYGDSYRNNYMTNAEQLHSGSLTDDPEAQIPVSNIGTVPEAAQDEDLATLRAANTSMVMSMSEDDSTIGSNHPQDPPTGSFARHPGSESFQAETAEDFSAYPLQRTVSDSESEDDLFDGSFLNLSDTGPRAGSTKREESSDPPADADLHALAAKVSDTPDDDPVNSLAAKVAQSQNSSNLVENSDDLIDKCVTELEESFME